MWGPWFLQEALRTGFDGLCVQWARRGWAPQLMVLTFSMSGKIAVYRGGTGSVFELDLDLVCEPAVGHLEQDLSFLPKR